MGSDRYFDEPPPPKPLWKQVRDLGDNMALMRAENKALHLQINRRDRRITELEAALKTIKGV